MIRLGTKSQPSDDSTDTSPIMKWNRIEGKLSLKLLLMIAMLNAFSAEDCCKRPIYAYGDKEAIPTECDKSKCTEEVIYAENAQSTGDVYKFLISVKKSSTIIMIGNTSTYNLAGLVEIVHKGPGSALTLMNVKLIDESFAKLKTIKVDDISNYCNGGTELIKIEGSIPSRYTRPTAQTACKSLTTTQPTVLGATQGVGVSSSNSSAAVISQLCTQKIDAEKEKCSSNNTLLYIACGVIVVLLIVSIVSTIIALKLYLWRHKKDLVLASFGSYAAQVFDRAIYNLCDQDCRSLMRVFSDTHADAADDAHDDVAREKKLAARRFWKVQQGKKLEPDDDFGEPPDDKFTPVTDDEVFRRAREGIMSEDVQEALQKYEEVKASIVTKGKFDPPKNVKPISDTRQRNHDLMAAMKSSSRKKVKPDAPFYMDPSMFVDPKKLAREGQLPKRPEPQSKDQTKSSVPASKDKVPAPQTNRKPAGAEAAAKQPAPAKKDAKKAALAGDHFEGTCRQVYDSAHRQQNCCSDSGSRESEVDPKYAGQIPKDVTPRALCKPLRIKTSACPEISKQFSGESDELKQTFTVLAMICNKFEEVLEAHRIAMNVLVRMVEDAVMSTRGAVYDTTIIREREGDLRVPLTQGVSTSACSEGTGKALGRSASSSVEGVRKVSSKWSKSLPNSFPTPSPNSPETSRCCARTTETVIQNSTTFSRMASDSVPRSWASQEKNYTYFWNKKTTTAEAVLPGETYEKAMVRMEEEMEDLNRVIDLYKIRKCRLRANRIQDTAVNVSANVDFPGNSTRKHLEDRENFSNVLYCPFLRTTTHGHTHPKLCRRAGSLSDEA
ncbi:unnamed protein product [Caenorhabditis auriculariae]|uniref:Uncharacterized protein n=1 Tax=Caenorhabditis auriculariae TaxID=2777116 RepID=A0A8S1HSV0_9PELO|nr:unnamed protein product [Caenorhabditis auriculariae]